jgi:hypothetical protein
MTDWNFDIASAPRGKTEETEQTRMYSNRTFETIRSIFVPDLLWLASNCGKVIKSHWIPEKGMDGGRWLGMNKGEQPVAWMLFVTPEHPFANAGEAGADVGAILAAEHLPIINDVGGM